jgi:hypothetical protein
MDKSKFIEFDQYLYKDSVDTRGYIYVGETISPRVGRFECDMGMFNIKYENMIPCTKPKAQSIAVGDTVVVVKKDQHYDRETFGMVGMVTKVSGASFGVKLSSINCLVWYAGDGLNVVNPVRKYPNPPLKHLKERIAFAMGANIQFSRAGVKWYNCEKGKDPLWLPKNMYRVKLEKSEDELRIEELERLITENLTIISQYRIELTELIIANDNYYE